MKILIVDPYYPKFLSDAYGSNPELSAQPYPAQQARLMALAFGTADFYSRRLRERGIDAIDVIANCDHLQHRWAEENGARIPGKRYGLIFRLLRRLARSRAPRDISPPEAIVLEQVKAFRPDVLFSHNLSFLSPSTIAAARRYVRLVVGQIACPLPEQEFLESYDLILTSFPHYVKRFRAMGIASEYFRLGFEPRVLDLVGRVDRFRPVTFVGGISGAHARGNELLESIARRLPLEVFGYGADSLRPGSALHRAHRGEAWGVQMYRALLESRITINRHIDVAENFANNMRLFEATGCGALLVTDAKENMEDLFRVGEEVLTYRDEDELVALVERYTADGAARERIARAGQARTLSEHSWERRMAELEGLLSKALSKSASMGPRAALA